MDVATTTAPRGDAADAPPPPGEQATTPIVLGVAATLSERLGIDALWVRLGFVLLALVGGLGVVVYLGLWLALIVGEQPGAVGRGARIGGGLALIVGIPLTLQVGGRFQFFTGPVAVIALLAGLTLALWSPRRSPTVRPVVAKPSVASDEPRASSRSRLARRARPPRPRRPRSYLGQATLGLAIVTAATGGLIDTLNGGRAHPEQWLGAAAAVCGAGLLVGALRGHARWLILPAAGFAVAGYVTGVAASVGVPLDNLGDDVFVALGTDGSLTGPTRAAFGDVNLDLTTAPDAPATVDVEIGHGDLRITRGDDVTVAVEAEPGRVTTVREQRPDGSVLSSEHVGPLVVGAGRPDVTVRASIGSGSIAVTAWAEVSPDVTLPTASGSPIDQGWPTRIGTLVPVDDTSVVSGTSDGWIVIGNDEALLSPSGTLEYSLNPTYTDEGGVVRVPTMFGEFALLPRQLLLLPDRRVLDLADVRAQLATRLGPTGDDGPPAVSTTAVSRSGTGDLLTTPTSTAAPSVVGDADAGTITTTGSALPTGTT